MERRIRSVLLEWDPIDAGVPDDEYDCLISPVVRRLESGADTPELAAWLWQEMDADFGLRSPVGTDEITERLHAAGLPPDVDRTLIGMSVTVSGRSGRSVHVPKAAV